jgi:LPS-assembly lipoprotein
MSSSDTRTAPRRAVVAAMAAALAASACGFHLRGEATYAFSSVFVSAPSQPAFAAELTRALEASGSVKLAPNAASAQAVVEITGIVDDKQVLSLSPGGRVQEYALSKIVGFRVRGSDGREWANPDEITIRRSYTYDDSERLAREIQEQRLLREMQSDAVSQIVRRLQSVRPPA